jgi:hypothetical protein
MKKFLLFALLSPLLGNAQKIENLRAVVQASEIVITYTISPTNTLDKFDISIYSSHNNYSTPLQQVSGDIGRGIGAGENKRIIWYARNELGDFKGDISFEVRAEVIATFVQTNQFNSVKRGKSIPITWRGGNNSQDVKVELLKGGVIESVIATTSNNGSYSWSIPSKEKVGSDYQIRLTNGKETVVSSSFSIKHKVPTLVKILPVAVIGVVVVLVTGKSKSSTEDAKTNLPTPPDLGL